MSIAIVTATAAEAAAVRRAMPQATVINAGIALARLTDRHFDSAIVCGLGGGLRDHTPTGTVVLASEVLRPDGTIAKTDDALTTALAAGARSLGFNPVVAPVLTSAALVTGPDRKTWAARGYALAEMEAGLIDATRLAVVRVVLDTPERELSDEWLHPLRACMKPRLWGELLWLARNAPRCARIAAEVVRAGLTSNAAL